MYNVHYKVTAIFTAYYRNNKGYWVMDEILSGYRLVGDGQYQIFNTKGILVGVVDQIWLQRSKIERIDAKLSIVKTFDGHRSRKQKV